MGPCCALSTDHTGSASIYAGSPSNDGGARMLCNLVCTSMGRQVHIDYCIDESGGPCENSETQHIYERMVPNPEQPKDWMKHGLFHWRRMGKLVK